MHTSRYRTEFTMEYTGANPIHIIHLYSYSIYFSVTRLVKQKGRQKGVWHVVQCECVGGLVCSLFHCYYGNFTYKVSEKKIIIIGGGSV